MIPILLPVVLAAILERPAARSSWLVLAGLPFSLATLLLSGSRNGWLGLAVGLAALALLDARRTRTLAPAGLVAAVFVASLALGVADVRQRAWSILDTARDPRIGQWLVAVEMFKDAPLVGKGVHIFGLAYPMYLERVTLPAGVAPDTAYIPWAHNLYGITNN